MPKEYDQSIEFISKSSISNVDYFRQILMDADKLSISIRWNFDEQQADSFHHNFTAHEFFKRLENMIGELYAKD
jgi:hypothetical protein